MGGEPVVPDTLRIDVLQGEGASYAAGSISYEGFTVAVRDGKKRPVAGAKVSFRLPEEGPTGRFPNGQASETALSDEAGRATVWGIQWGHTPGICTLVITARLGGVSAGTTAQVRITAVAGGSARASAQAVEPPPGLSRPEEEAATVQTPEAAPAPSSKAPSRPAVIISSSGEPGERFSSGRSRWVYLALGVAAAAGAVLAWKLSTTTPAAAPVATAPRLSLGPPTITISRP